jgi:hypothetical protein
MSIQRILVLVLLLLTATTATLLITSNSDVPAPEEPAPPAMPSPATPQASPAAPAKSKENPPPPPQAGQAPVQAPTIEPPPDMAPEESDEQIEKEQVAAALAQLTSSDPAQRLEGAEQLGAYPSKEAETALQQVLATDSDADVRNAAAQSLGYVEKPTQATLNTLFSALEDQNEDVRLSALSTLEDFMLGADENSKRYKQILAGLQAKVDSRSVPQETRDAIRDIVTDQTAPPEAEPQ